MIKGKFAVVQEANEYFTWIKGNHLDGNEKLNELVQLRNFLKETFVLKNKDKEENRDFIAKIDLLISEIDRYWWKLFTKG